MEDKQHKNANGARLNHGETVLQVQAALGMTGAGWLSPDVVVDAVKRLKRQVDGPPTEYDLSVVAKADEFRKLLQQIHDEPRTEMEKAFRDATLIGMSEPKFWEGAIPTFVGFGFQQFAAGHEAGIVLASKRQDHMDKVLVEVTEEREQARAQLRSLDRCAPAAYVPIHPRNGPLWASTIPSLDRDHPSYEMRPVYFAPQRSTSVLNDEMKGGEA